MQVTYRRMKDALIQLSKGVHKGPAADLIPVLFGERPPTVTKKDVKFTPFNSNLDHSQVCIFYLVFPFHNDDVFVIQIVLITQIFLLFTIFCSQNNYSFVMNVIMK